MGSLEIGFYYHKTNEGHGTHNSHDAEGRHINTIRSAHFTDQQREDILQYSLINVKWLALKKSREIIPPTCINFRQTWKSL